MHFQVSRISSVLSEFFPSRCPLSIPFSRASSAAHTRASPPRSRRRSVLQATPWVPRGRPYNKSGSPFEKAADDLRDYQTVRTEDDFEEFEVTSNSLNHVLHVIKWQIKNIFGGNIFWNVHHSGKTTSYLKLLILSWQHGSRGDFLKRVQTVLKLSDIGCQSPW